MGERLLFAQSVGRESVFVCGLKDSRRGLSQAAAIEAGFAVLALKSLLECVCFALGGVCMCVRVCKAFWAPAPAHLA